MGCPPWSQQLQKLTNLVMLSPLHEHNFVWELHVHGLITDGTGWTLFLLLIHFGGISELYYITYIYY